MVNSKILTAQHSTAQHSLRRRLLTSAVTEKDDNLTEQSY